MSDVEEYRTEIATDEGLRSKFIVAFRHAECLLKNGDRVDLIVRPALDEIKAQQRKFLKDIVFGQIAEQVQVPVFDMQGRHTGRRERFDKTVWAEKFRRDLLGYRYEMQRMPGSKKATPVRVRISTENLGVKRYSEYTDRCIDHAVVEYGVQFHFTRDERDSVRYRGPTKKGREQ